jgi:O-antigen ligase
MLMFIMIPQFIDHTEIRRQIVFSYVLSILPLLLTVFAELLYNPSVLFSASKPGWDYCNPCTIAQNIVPVMIFSIALMFCTTSRTTKFVCALLAVVTSVALLAIKARAPLLALTIALIVFFLLTEHSSIRRTLRLAAIGLLLVAGAVIVAFPDDSTRWATSDVLKIRTASGKPRSFVEFTSTRSITMMSALREWEKHPILGTGLGTKVRHPIRQYKWDIRLGTSSYLIILSETGAVGLALFIALLIAGTAGAYRTLREPLGLQDNTLALASFSIIVGFLVHALIDDALSSFGSSVGVLVFCLLGLGANSQAQLPLEDKSAEVSLTQTSAFPAKL